MNNVAIQTFRDFFDDDSFVALKSNFVFCKCNGQENFDRLIYAVHHTCFGHCCFIKVWFIMLILEISFKSV